jgi:hypothetical protein
MATLPGLQELRPPDPQSPPQTPQSAPSSSTSPSASPKVEPHAPGQDVEENDPELSAGLETLAGTLTRIGVDCRHVGENFAAAAAQPAVGFIAVLNRLNRLEDNVRRTVRHEVRRELRDMRTQLHDTKVVQVNLQNEMRQTLHQVREDVRVLHNQLVIEYVVFFSFPFSPPLFFLHIPYSLLTYISPSPRYSHRNANARVSNSVLRVSDPLVPLLATDGTVINTFPRTSEAITTMSRKLHSGMPHSPNSSKQKNFFCSLIKEKKNFLKTFRILFPFPSFFFLIVWNANLLFAFRTIGK